MAEAVRSSVRHDSVGSGSLGHGLCDGQQRLGACIDALQCSPDCLIVERGWCVSLHRLAGAILSGAVAVSHESHGCRSAAVLHVLLPSCVGDDFLRPAKQHLPPHKPGAATSSGEHASKRSKAASDRKPNVSSRGLHITARDASTVAQGATTSQQAATALAALTCANHAEGIRDVLIAQRATEGTARTCGCINHVPVIVERPSASTNNDRRRRPLCRQGHVQP